MIASRSSSHSYLLRDPWDLDEAMEVVLGHGRHWSRSLYARGARRASLSAVIVGAGFGGVAATIELERQGVEDFVVLERGDRHRRRVARDSLPGAALTSPPPLLAVLRAQPRLVAALRPGDGIQDYLERVADEHDVPRHVRFGVEVARAGWDADAPRWRIGLDDGGARGRHPRGGRRADSHGRRAAGSRLVRRSGLPPRPSGTARSSPAEKVAAVVDAARARSAPRSARGRARDGLPALGAVDAAQAERARPAPAREALYAASRAAGRRRPATRRRSRRSSRRSSDTGDHREGHARAGPRVSSVQRAPRRCAASASLLRRGHPAYDPAADGPLDSDCCRCSPRERLARHPADQRGRARGRRHPDGRAPRPT